MEKLDISPKIKDEAMYKKISLALGVAFLILGIKDRDIAKLIFGVLFVFYYTYKKTIYLTDEGVLFTYKGLLFNKEELIDKNYVHEVLIVKQGLKTALYFVVEPTAKRIIVDTEKVDDIINFIKNRLKLCVSVESRVWLMEVFIWNITPYIIDIVLDEI